MPRILAVADEPYPGLPDLTTARPDVVLSCGDLPWDDLERIVDVTNVPLLFVPGNHDPALTPSSQGVVWPFTIANPHLVDPPVRAGERAWTAASWTRRGSGSRDSEAPSGTGRGRTNTRRPRCPAALGG